MSKDFEWRFEDELPDQQAEEEPTGRPGWRRWVPWLLVLLLVASSGYAWWRDRQRNLTEAEAQVRQVAELELRALTEGDVELVMSLQDRADRSWRRAQAGYVESGGLPRPLQTSGTAVSTTVASARVVGDRARVAIVHRATLGPGEEVIFRAARFYRYTHDGRWLHTRADDDTGGQTVVLKLDEVRVAAFRRDAGWVEPLASSLGTAVHRFCGLVACRQDLPLDLDLAADLEAGAAPDDTTLPAPFLTGAPENDAARQAWEESLGQLLVDRLVEREIAARRARPADETVGRRGLEARRAGEDDESGLRVRETTARDLELLRHFLEAARWIPTPRLWETLSDPDAWRTLSSPGSGRFPPLVAEEKRRMRTADADLRPGFLDLPDLGPPPKGWIAFMTPDEDLALISPHGSRRVALTETGGVEGFVWSPDGGSLAFVQQGKLMVLSLEEARFTPLTAPRAVGHRMELAWSQDSERVAHLDSLRQDGTERIAPNALGAVDVVSDEAEGDDLPWWAAVGFEKAFAASPLHREHLKGPPRFTVAPDGESVAFAYLSAIDPASSPVGVYVWDGEGEPVAIAAGWDPAWQPETSLAGGD